mmetsp:Transcript_123102/g.359433  ORF Transcript_123102/g.359433 Transcript_123102/m.359433 type:complete len:261 (-) Transcript_123102:152-934(-)
MRIERALSAGSVFGANLLAAMMSAASFFRASRSAACWDCSRSSTILRLSSVTSPSIMAAPLSSACVASISTSTTRSVACDTRDSETASGSATTFGAAGAAGSAGSASTSASASPPTCGSSSSTTTSAEAGAGFPPAVSTFRAFASASCPGGPGAVRLSSTRRSGCTFPFHGTRQPVFGGDGSCRSQRDQTCDPPTSSPKYQPMKSAPSRWSQKYRKTVSSSTTRFFLLKNFLLWFEPHSTYSPTRVARPSSSFLVLQVTT